MSLINVTDLTFAYDGSYDNVFENVSFRIDTDWKLGFTGRNGRGKTTFLNLLLGRYEYGGHISSSVEFEYFPFDVPDKSANTADIVNSVCKDYAEWELMRELSILEVPEEVLCRPFDTLSDGERTKVLLAALFLKGNSFLLIDEPTNHLDGAARDIVSRYLKSKNGFILVSHDRAFLDGCVDHILSINKTNIEVQRGNFSSWYKNKEMRDGYEIAENERLKKDMKRLKQAARTSGKWADRAESVKIGMGSAGDNRAYVGEKSRRMQQQRKNLERRQQSMAEEKSAMLKNVENAEALKISQLRYHSDTLVSLRDISVNYGEKAVCSGVSFEIKRGDKIALSGGNGSGKSSLIKLVCGEKIEYSGNLHIGSGLLISYVSQDTSFLKGNLSDYARASGIDESLFKAILRKLDFSRTQFEKDMNGFSEGQKKKTLIAKSLCEKAHIYVWDEPLNFIDVLSRMQIENLLIGSGVTLLFVEHDGAFREKIATKKVFLDAVCRV